MSSKYAIKHAIQSIANTKKATYAMEIIAATRMRSTKPKLLVARSYLSELKKLVERLYSQEIEHPLFQEGQSNIDGILIIANDESMCGAMITDTISALKNCLKEYPDAKIAIFGSNAAEHLRNTLNLDFDLVSPLKSASPELIWDWWKQHQFANLHVISQEAAQIFAHHTLINTLIPMETPRKINQEYEFFEPERTKLFAQAVRKYILAKLKLYLLESYFCAQATRMIAMKSATDNANKLIIKNNLLYNKLRQGEITEELIEMMAGAQAV